MIFCARSTLRSREARTCERFVYSVVKITRLYDYQTWRTLFFWEIHEVRKGIWAFLLDCALWELIGWASYGCICGNGSWFDSFSVLCGFSSRTKLPSVRSAWPAPPRSTASTEIWTNSSREFRKRRRHSHWRTWDETWLVSRLCSVNTKVLSGICWRWNNKWTFWV